MAKDKITWNNCFSSERYGVKQKKRGLRTEYERDWDRLIFSSAFRRLQNKTQVFPLPQEVFVHNRLTHSLEVASVGRSLGKLIGKEISEIKEVKKHDTSRSFYRNHLKNVIASACLAHDMGNPAFGHSGEDAISKYFIDNSSKKFDGKKLINHFSKEEWEDLKLFEGNANTLRILTKDTQGKVKGGYRLTYSTLASIIKYPCAAHESQGKKGSTHRKKYGFIQRDMEVFLEITEKLNMVSEKGTLTSFKRHPFVYLVEAADDICYNIIDFEDAHRLGIISHSEIIALFLELIKHDSKTEFIHIKKMVESEIEDNNEKVAYLRAKAINFLTKQCVEVFLNNKDDILKGNFKGDLLENISKGKTTIEKIKSISYKRIYNYESVVKIELAGFRIMSGIIEDFVEAALTPVKDKIKRHEKILKLLPKPFEFNESDSSYVKVVNIIDYVSGMTDLYALKLYRNLRGIEMPNI